MAIDMSNIDKEYFETVVMLNPFAFEIECNNQTPVTRNTLQYHTLLIFPGMEDGDRIAAFDRQRKMVWDRFKFAK